MLYFSHNHERLRTFYKTCSWSYVSLLSIKLWLLVPGNNANTNRMLNDRYTICDSIYIPAPFHLKSEFYYVNYCFVCVGQGTKLKCCSFKEVRHAICFFYCCPWHVYNCWKCCLLLCLWWLMIIRMIFFLQTFLLITFFFLHGRKLLINFFFYSNLWNKPTMTCCLFSYYMNTPTYL